MSDKLCLVYTRNGDLVHVSHHDTMAQMEAEQRKAAEGLAFLDDTRGDWAPMVPGTLGIYYDRVQASFTIGFKSKPETLGTQHRDDVARKARRIATCAVFQHAQDDDHADEMYARLVERVKADNPVLPVVVPDYFTEDFSCREALSFIEDLESAINTAFGGL